MKKYISLAAFGLLAAMLTVTSCGKDDDKDGEKTKEPVPVTGVVVISPEGQQVTLEKGKTFQIEAHVLPENATDQEISYSSNRPSVASVDEKGLITAIDGPLHGQVTITVKSHEHNYVKYIRVDVPKEAVHATSISFSHSSYEIEQHQPTLLYVTAKPSDAVYPGITFTSSNPSVVEITQQSGYMVYVEGKKGGTATITATTQDGNLTATTEVKVSDAYVTSISLGTSSVTLSKGKTYQLQATVKRSNGTSTTSNAGVTFATQDPNVATVSESGLITAVAYGSTRITASIGGKTTSIVCKVNPEEPKNSTEAIRMLRDCQWKVEKELKDTYYDEIRYEFTEDAHFYKIYHVRTDLSSKHEYYKWRGEYVGYEYPEHCQITPDGSDPTKGEIQVEEQYFNDGSVVPPVCIRYSKLNQAGWYKIEGVWESTHDGLVLKWPSTGYNMSRTKEKVSFILLDF